MNIGLTGHTRGLGKAIEKCFVENGHRVIGFSSSNGFDITDNQRRSEIIDKSVDCEIFFNNAYADFAQTELLYELFKAWSGKDKVIICIGSTVTTGVVPHFWRYASHKYSLDKACEQLAFLNDPCKVANFRFGWIGTERVLDVFKPKNFLHPDEVAKFIYEQLKWVKLHRLNEITLRPN